MKEQGLTPIGTRWALTNKGDTEHPFIRARLVAQETKRTTNMDLTVTSMTFAATPLVEGFRFLLSMAMTGEKKRNLQDELVIAFIDISRAHFHSPVRRKVPIRMQGDPSCPQELPCSIAQCMERRTQHNALVRSVNGRWRNLTTTLVCTNRGCTNILSKTSVYSDTVVIFRHLRHMAEFKENLSKHLLVKDIATLGPRPQLLDACEVRFLNRVIRWVVPPFGKAPERIEIEADPRHLQLLIRNSGLQTSSKGVNTPGERTRESSCTIKLSPQDPTSYRSNVMRRNRQ